MMGVAMGIQTQVIELEASWLLIVFRGPRPPLEKRAFWLNRTLEEWLGEHPDRSIARTLPIQHRGELVAVHVWLDEPEAAAPRGAMLQLDRRLASTMPKEHLEAMLQAAYEILFERPQAARLIVINRRNIAVIFDRPREQIAILPFERLQLDEPSTTGFHKWQADKQTWYFVIELPAAQGD